MLHVVIYRCVTRESNRCSGQADETVSRTGQDDSLLLTARRRECHANSIPVRQMCPVARPGHAVRLRAKYVGYSDDPSLPHTYARERPAWPGCLHALERCVRGESDVAKYV